MTSGKQDASGEFIESRDNGYSLLLFRKYYCINKHNIDQGTQKVR